jgi:hypothetical protein
MYLRGLKDVNPHKKEEDEAHLHRIVEEIKEDAVKIQQQKLNYTCFIF